MSSTNKIAIVRVRGLTGVKTETQDTMFMLHLHRKNYCTVVEDNASFRGMVHKVKDFVTYGEIDDETLKLLEKKGEGKKYYRLSPPRKGYGRKGIKFTFAKGGALSDRKEKINDLIKRML